MVKKKLLLLAVVLISTSVVAFAQDARIVQPGGRATGNDFIIKTNITDATIFVNEEELKPERDYIIRNRTQYELLLTNGTLRLKIEKPGYETFEQRFVVRRDFELELTFKQQSFSLGISSNVGGAQIKVNGATTGATPATLTLLAGSYEIEVSAPGYVTQTRGVGLDSNQSIVFRLEPIRYQLTVDSNVGNAQVLVDGAIVGRSPFTTSLAPGVYSLTVRAPGYIDYTSQVQISRDSLVTARLQPMPGTLKIILPSGTQADIYIDGARQLNTQVELLPGVHQVRLVIGGFSIEQTIEIISGQVLQIKPMFSLQVQ